MGSPRRQTKRTQALGRSRNPQLASLFLSPIGALVYIFGEALPFPLHFYKSYRTLPCRSERGRFSMSSARIDLPQGTLDLVILRTLTLGGCDFFDFFQVLGPESSGEHRPTTILGVLRLRARNPLLSDRSARRFAQDDGPVGVLKNLLVGCVKTTKIKKVTTSRDSAWLGNCGAGAADFK
jgi:hypothetical protein